MCRYWYSLWVLCVNTLLSNILNLIDRGWLKRSATWMKRRAFVSEVPTGEPRERQRATKSKRNMVSFTIHLSLPYSVVNTCIHTYLLCPRGTSLYIFCTCVNNCYLFFLYWFEVLTLMKGQELINVWNESPPQMLILLTCPVALLIVHAFSPLYLSIVAVFVAFNLCIQCIEYILIK